MIDLLRFAIDEDVFALAFWSLVAVVAVGCVYVMCQAAEAFARMLSPWLCGLATRWAAAGEYRRVRRETLRSLRVIETDGVLEAWAYDEWAAWKSRQPWPAGDVLDVAREVFDSIEVSQEIPGEAER